MALARVVSFKGVNDQRIAELRKQITAESRPDDIPASEIVILHDSDAQTALAIVFFENDDDYARGDAALSAMPSDETPGARESVSKYEVAIRVQA